ncbi:hypothetical protein [Allokutzneria albata]|nr:hypothetical protein [Allokutzneria albata]
MLTQETDEPVLVNLADLAQCGAQRFRSDFVLGFGMDRRAFCAPRWS